MNKRIKVGLFLQIPNLLILLIIISEFMIDKINWQSISYNIGYILIGTTFALINITSIIYLITGFLEN